MTNTQLITVGGAKGGGGGAPRAPVIQPDSLRSLAIIELVEALGEGEIEGFATADPLESIYLDDTPLKAAGVDNFGGISVDYRLGTQAQTYMPGSIDNSTASLTAVDVEVLNGTPVVRSITDTTTDAVRVTLLFAALMKQDATTGDRSGVAVQVWIDVRLDGTAWVPVDLHGRGVVSGKTESAYERSYTINLKEFGPATTYDVRVSRISPNPVAGENSSFKWESLTKLSYAKLRYPNTVVVRTTFDARSFNKIPKRSYLIKGLKVKVPGPSVYNPESRVYTGTDWDGNFVTAWTRNPAWIFYDLVTDPRYGLGQLINPIYQDKWTLFSIAKRCDELVPDGFGGQEPRYSLDLYLQSDDDAKKVVMDIASAFDTMAYWSAGSILATQDAPKATAALFVPGNVVKGQFNYAGSARQVRYTVALVQWNDPDDQYRIATEYVEDLDGIARYGYREKQIAAIGCTSRGQAHRAGKRILLTSRLETDTVSFAVGLDGMAARIGDVIRIADPLRTSGERYGGRVKVGSDASTVLLDAPVTLSSGITYKIAVIKSTGEVIEGVVTNAAGTHSSISVFPALSAVPEADAAWIIYNPAEAGRQYRIVTITENENKSDGFYSISAVQYAPEKYALIDDLNDLPPIPVNPFINNSVVPPSGLLVSEGVYSALEGVRRYIDLSWSASTDPFLSGYRLVYRHDGDVLFDNEIDGQSYRIQNPPVGEWEFTLQAVTILGKFSTSITVTYTLGEMYLVESVSVTGLTLIGGGTTFTGRQFELDWDTDALTVLGFSDAYGVGQGGQSPWFRDYQVDIYNGATLLRSEFVTESKYVYTYDKNLEDGGPRRNVMALIRARDMNGRYSQSASITVSNPAPAAISSVNVYPSFEALIISYTRPADNDWLGVIVFLNTSSGFTPAAPDIIYVGTDTTITIPNLAVDTPYFIRIASYDAFGGENDYTLSATEYTATISSISLPTPDEIKAGLQSALNDPAATPLVFEADVFAVNLSGVDKTPFIIGLYNGAPAILMDSDVVVTGDLSVDQLVGGRIAATEDIIIGNGNARINGDGSIIVYDGPDTVSNRDFAILTGGTLSFQRYRNGAYHEYKSVRRIEDGVAPSGSTVTLPGYWDSQPRIIISPAALESYNIDVTASQGWVLRADNLAEITPGSGVWEFDAIAELHYSDNAGVQTVASNSGNLAVNGWTSGESTLPLGTVSVTVSAKFSSIRGDGISTYGYYYRSVSWTIQGWDGSIWSDLATKTRNIASAEHGQQITDTNPVNIPAGTTKIRVVFTAFDTNGATYSLGANDYVYYQHTITAEALSVQAIHDPGIEGHLEPGHTTTATLTSASYTPPAGHQLLSVEYTVDYELYGTLPSGDATQPNHKIFNGAIVYLNVTQTRIGTSEFYSISPEYLYGSVSTGPVAMSAYNNAFWSVSNTNVYGGYLVSHTKVLNPSAVLNLRYPDVNSDTPVNNFTFQDYAWNISGAAYIAQGSLNWMAIGD